MNDFIEFRHIISNLLRWWWVIALITMVTATIGYGISLMQTPYYQATSTVMVGQFYQATVLDRNDILTSQLLAETYVDMAESEQILQAVIDTLGLSKSWLTLKSQVKVSRKSDTALLKITVETPSSQDAEAITAEIGRQLLLLSPANTSGKNLIDEKAFLRQRMESLQVKIEAGQTQLSLLEEGLYQMLPIEKATKLRDDISVLEELIVGWEDRYSQMLMILEQNTTLNALTIIEPAQVKSKPIRPQPIINIIIASLTGFTLSLGVVFLIGFFDSSIKSELEIAAQLGIRPLGTINYLKRHKQAEMLLVTQNAFAPLTEAYRIIRSNLQFQAKHHLPQFVVITSANIIESKSITAANLAITMAQAGLKTLVVDGDLRQPKQHDIFLELNRIGLSDLLRSSAIDLERTLIDTRVENLRLLPCGTLANNPTELLGSLNMDALLTTMADLADVIIFDSAPILPVADTPILASKVSNVILVIESAKTKRSEAQQAKNMLIQTGATIVGAVLNNSTHRWPKNRGYASHLAQQLKPNGQAKKPLRKERSVTFESQ